MKKFFDESNVPENHLVLFKEVLSGLNDKSVNGAFFCGFPFLEVSEESKKIPMRGLIICNHGLFIFYDKNDEIKLYRRNINKVMMNGENISEVIMDNPAILYFFHISEDSSSIVEKILGSEVTLNDMQVREAISIIQNILNLIPKDNRKISKPDSIGAKIVRRSREEANFDECQFRAIYQENSQHMRIRGLAGSGKTILLVKKLAYLHFKYPDLNLAYIFFTKSLKQTIDNFFVRFYKEIDPYGNEPNMEKVHIMHGWGNLNSPGLYSILCSKLGYSNEQYSPENDLDKICNALLHKIVDENQIEKIKIFDYILIDEAQDFTLNFFKLAMKSLKVSGKFIYAYDELQTLNEYKTKMPEPKEILGSNTKYLDRDLSVCYRSPKEIIVTAHALGLGIYHKNKEGNIEFCNVVEDRSIWNATGYKTLKGSIDYGERVVLSREEIIKNEISDIIISEKLSQEEQRKRTVEEIIFLIKHEDVNPEDILIIDLDTINLKDNFIKFCEYTYEYFENNGCIDEDGKRLFELNLVNKDSSYSFKLKGFISYTTIFRAKGNESNIVFILNTGKMSSQLSASRNRLFTAMTRAKFKVYLFGEGMDMDSIISEINDVKNNNYTLSFVYPSKEELIKYKHKFYIESQKASKFEFLFGTQNISPFSDKKELLKMIVEQFGTEEITAILKSFKKNGEFKK